MTTKEKLQDLVKRYQYAKDKGQLQNASEATKIGRASCRERV